MRKDTFHTRCCPFCGNPGPQKQVNSRSWDKQVKLFQRMVPMTSFAPDKAWFSHWHFLLIPVAMEDTWATVTSRTCAQVSGNLYPPLLSLREVSSLGCVGPFPRPSHASMSAVSELRCPLKKPRCPWHHALGQEVLVPVFPRMCSWVCLRCDLFGGQSRETLCTLFMAPCRSSC